MCTLCCRKQYICSYDPGLDCPAGWVSHQGSCYWASSILASWLTAQTLCKVTTRPGNGTLRKGPKLYCNLWQFFKLKRLNSVSNVKALIG